MTTDIKQSAAEALCIADDTWEHHDQTDDFPCSRCVREAAKDERD